MLTHSNIAENAAMLVETFRMSADSKFGAWIPHYHDMGLMGLILPAWYVGSSATVMSPTAFMKRPVRWLELVDRHDLAWSAAPDFAYDLCTRTVTDDQLERLDLSRWRYAANGSEPVRAATLDAFAKRFAQAGLRREALNPCYGLAEATVFVAGTGNREPVVRRVEEAALATGRLVDADAADQGPQTRDLVSSGSVRGMDAIVVDPQDGSVLPPGRIGELWLRGPGVGVGYWRNAAESDRVFHATTADGQTGFLRTGDLAVIDAGELYVTGRIKDLIIIRGRNIYPQDVEHVVREEIPELRGLFGAAFGVVTASGEEAVAVVHEVRPGVGADRLAEIGAAIGRCVAREIGVSTTAAVQLLRRGTVPRTTSGKVQRNAVRTAFLEGTTTALWSSVDPAIRMTGSEDPR
jgi:acyl-CoA synthetase (AMP-forming)/AMP-acid ligase II